MADTENPGLCDETLDIFGEFMTMVEETSNLPGMDFDCSICMDWTPVVEVFGPVSEADVIYMLFENDDIDINLYLPIFPQ